MFDARLLPITRQILAKPADRFAALGFSADHVTIAGFLLGLMSLPALAMEAYGVALILILLNRCCDGLDGEIARRNGPTDRGAYLDIALDFMFYALVPVGFALAAPENALPAAFLIASFVGTGSSFLAFSLIAERRGMASKDYPQKGIYYLGGLTEGTETILFLILCCLFPETFPVLAFGFATFCFITMLTRWHAGWSLFNVSSNTI